MGDDDGVSDISLFVFRGPIAGDIPLDGAYTPFWREDIVAAADVDLDGVNDLVLEQIDEGDGSSPVFVVNGEVDLVIGGASATDTVSEVLVVPGPLSGALDVSLDASIEFVPPVMSGCARSQVAPAGDVNGAGWAGLMVFGRRCSAWDESVWILSGPEIPAPMSSAARLKLIRTRA